MLCEFTKPAIKEINMQCIHIGSLSFIFNMQKMYKRQHSLIYLFSHCHDSWHVSKGTIVRNQKDFSWFVTVLVSVLYDIWLHVYLSVD